MVHDNGAESDGIKYPWQQYVLEAFVASPESLPAKINVAERAIAVRLTERLEPGPEERLALNDARGPCTFSLKRHANYLRRTGRGHCLITGILVQRSSTLTTARPDKKRLQRLLKGQDP